MSAARSINYHEQRSAERAWSYGLAVLLVIDSDNQDAIGTAFRARVVNVSPNGLRVSSGALSELMDGGTFDLWIAIDGHDSKFFLQCETSWVSWEANGEFHMGVEILHRFDTDAEQWRRLHS